MIDYLPLFAGDRYDSSQKMTPLHNVLPEEVRQRKGLGTNTNPALHMSHPKQ